MINRRSAGLRLWIHETLLYGAFECGKNGPQIVFLQLWREKVPWRRPCCRYPFLILHIGWGNLFSRIERRWMRRSIIRKPCTEWYAASKDSSNRIRSILWILLPLMLRSSENSNAKTLHAEMHHRGLGSKSNQAEPITEDEEALLWATGKLGTHSAEVMLNTVYYYNCKVFGLRWPVTYHP